MNTTDKLTLKALLLKQSLEGACNFTESHLEHALEHDKEASKGLRNICAFISTQLFEKVEQTCQNLELSKRQLIEMALIDIIDKADEIMSAHNVFESLDNPEEA